MLKHKVKNYIQKNQLVLPGSRILLAVSGGPDSMALLYLLHVLASWLGCELAVAHLNHGLRAEAVAEEALVRDNCAALGLPFHARTADVAGMARQMKTSVEDAGRRARYGFFQELAPKLNIDRIATAHHYDDVAETVLLHLLRGTGITGLRGIRPLHGNLIRPLLAVTKAELQTYVDDNSIPYCMDPSNENPDFIRSRIRHRLIPYLQRDYNPRIVEGLNHLALIARDEDEILETETLRHWGEVCRLEETGHLVLNNSQLASLHLAYQRRIIRRALSSMVAEAAWSLDDVEKVIALEGKPGSACTLHLKKGLRITKAYDKIIFTTQPEQKHSFRVQLPVPGKVAILSAGLTLQISRVERDLYQPQPGDLVLDYDRLPDSLWLRSRQIGDIFRPPGMEGSKKLKKWFIDAKIPAAERDQVPLLSGEGPEIYAIWGHAVSRTASVHRRTRWLLVLRPVADRDGSA